MKLNFKKSLISEQTLFIMEAKQALNLLFALRHILYLESINRGNIPVNI